ncbi:formyltetrahydrofolate deformylase [Elongatibacter sediminis]|uniref:Formyltetrahydrofolate deformylase n=1 Tax=Elongatibacter sediminis TaxID=3119006 RepID=A0AAW9RD33_9GAMM
MKRNAYTLKASCTDTVGIVAAVTGFIADRGGLITEMSHFVDDMAQKSFIRTVFEDDATSDDETRALQAAFKESVARRFAMTFSIIPPNQKLRTLIAVSRQSHCLNSLLYRWSDGHLPIEITGVVSNHEDQRSRVEWYGLPYHHFRIEPGRKPEQEARILDLFEETGSQLLILARYMQILTPHACSVLGGRAINIHHSFLPGFKGARPYHQAFERGVKLIGATAHYVNTELDEGPIIEQDVVRVDHTMTAGELERLGQDVESVVLNRAVRWHAEHRVFENGHRTVVLRH